MTRRLMRHAALLAIGVFLGGCVPLPGGRSLQRDIITGKTGESTLISGAGTCKVPPRIFDSLTVGDGYRCVWTPDPTTVGDPRQAGGLPAKPRPKWPPAFE